MPQIKSKFRHMVEAWSLYLAHPDGLMDDDLAQRFGVNRTTIVRLRQEFGDKLRKVKHGYYTIDPDDDDVKLAKAILKRASK